MGKIRQSELTRLVQESLQILTRLGVPLGALTERRKVKMCKAFMAVADVRPGKGWVDCSSIEDGYCPTSRQVIAHMNTYLGESISSGSYDDIRRKDLSLPVEALIVVKSAKNPDANTNDGTRGFAISLAAAQVIRQFGTEAWDAASDNFLAGRVSLATALLRERQLARIEVKIGDGRTFEFGPGGHNLLQKAIIDEFLPIYGHGAEVLYVGDASNKSLFLNAERLAALNFFELSHDKLPDVVAYSADRNWLFLIEAVTTANPISELRRKTLLELAQGCVAALIFVTAFPNRTVYRKFSADIAWETEVWLADSPHHMIHLNGDKFMGPYPTAT